MAYDTEAYDAEAYDAAAPEQADGFIAVLHHRQDSTEFDGRYGSLRIVPRQVEFVSLVEHGERFFTRKGVDVAFEVGVAWVWEDDGPSAHGAQIRVRELLAEWPGHMDHPEAAWLVPHLEQLEAGSDPDAVRDVAIAAYTERHRREPGRFAWDVPDGLL